MSDPVMTEFRAQRWSGVDTFAQLNEAFAGKDRDGFLYERAASSQVHDNGVRALRAGDGLIAYARICGTEHEDAAATLAGFLADLRHLADAMGIDWDEARREGDVHYTCELSGAG